MNELLRGTWAVRARRAGLVALVVVLAACGSGDGGGEDLSLDDDESIIEDLGTESTESTEVEETTTSTTEASAAVEPCEIVTQAEAEAVAGAALDAPWPAPAGCTFVGSPTGPTAQFEVFVGDGAHKFLEIDRDLGHDLQPIPGAGDEAYIEDGTAFVRSGSVWVALRVVRLDDPAVYRQTLIDLATAVAGRI